MRSQIKLYEASDKRALLQFLRSEKRGIRQYYYNPDNWNWQFAENPNNPILKVQVWLVKRDSEVIGQLGSIPVQLKIGNTCYSAAWAIDFMVNANYQNRGVGPLLIKELDKAVDVCLSLGPNENGYGLCKRMGWVEVGRVRLLARYLSWRRILKEIIKSFLKKEYGSFVRLSKLLISKVFAINTKSAKNTFSEDFTIERISSFGSEFDEFWENVSHNYPIIVKRDAKYLGWKFIRNPIYDYTIYTAKRKQQLMGYVVLRDDKTCGRISDFLATESAIAPLLQVAMQHFRKARTEKVICWFSNEDYVTAVKDFGFIELKSNERLLFNANSSRLDQHILCKFANWFITGSDGDRER